MAPFPFSTAVSLLSSMVRLCCSLLGCWCFLACLSSFVMAVPPTRVGDVNPAFWPSRGDGAVERPVDTSLTGKDLKK
ncbi:hypothetical protein IGI04_007929 [Brassica rapa subsp. trilocularis]|uniref:Secreted protein n=1 Tax=Brassica rapa subsp. trilocularis TaxID=1813537 RepID=A0ABQ7NNI9_BRACM|nr:hypothetical protein IGI04_007929 [Brassica rapa subsp. trilocularis]